MMQKGGLVYLRSFTKGALLLLIFLVPLFFLPMTVEPLELSKQTLLLILTCFAGLLWLTVVFIEKTIIVRGGWMSFLPLPVVLAFLLPAVFSLAPYLSTVGAHRQEYTSVLTVLACAVVFFLLMNTVHHRQDHQKVFLVLLLGTTLTVMLALAQMVGWTLLSTLSSQALNTVGTLSGFITYLVVFHSLFLGAFLMHKNGDSLLYAGWVGRLQMVLIFLVSVAIFLFLLVLDDASLWFLFVCSVLIPCGVFVVRAKDAVSSGRIVWSTLLLVGALVFWVGFTTVLPLQVPLEVTLNTQSSWNIAKQTLETHSLAFGSGPGTYVFDYARFHDVSLNKTDFWNTRFDRASSFVLTLLPTIGVVGMVLLIMSLMGLVVQMFRFGFKSTSHSASFVWLSYIAPWVLLIVSGFLVPWNMTLMVSFAVCSGLLVSTMASAQWKNVFVMTRVMRVVHGVVFILLAVCLLAGVVLSVSRYVAEASFARAVETDRQEGSLEEIVTLLERAHKLNPLHDTYARNLGEALLLRVDEVLAGVTSIEGLSAESAQEVQALTTSAVNAVSMATQRSPHNVLNWLSRGFVFRELVPVLQTADAFAIESYQKAVELEPVNPAHWTQLGKTYLVVAEQVSLLTVSPDAQVAQQAVEQKEAYLSQAQSSFERAIELKPNYAPAHFQLAVTFERQGNINQAIGKMESTAQYNPQDIGVHFQLAMMYLQRAGKDDLGRAQVALEHTITLAPSFSNAHWFLASIYEQQGDIASAVRQIEKVLELNPGNELVLSRLEHLSTGQLATEPPEALVL